MPVSVSTLDAATLTAPLNGEKLYSPTALARASNIPGHRGGPHLNGSTLFRHITKGVRAANGELVRLEAVRVGSRWLSSLEALARFTARLTEASLPSDQPAPEPAPTPARSKRAAARASAEVESLLGPTA